MIGNRFFLEKNLLFFLIPWPKIKSKWQTKSTLDSHESDLPSPKVYRAVQNLSTSSFRMRRAVDSNCVCLWRIPHPPCFADDTAHVADVSGGLHMVALDVPDHGGAPRGLLAAQVAGVHAVLVRHEAVDQGVEVRTGVARSCDVLICKSSYSEE